MVLSFLLFIVKTGHLLTKIIIRLIRRTALFIVNEVRNRYFQLLKEEISVITGPWGLCVICSGFGARRWSGAPPAKQLGASERNLIPRMHPREKLR